jgi:cell division protein FtsN
MPKKRKTTQRKTARRKTSSRKTRARRQTAAPSQGWAWGLLGLGFGLSVSAVIYLQNRAPSDAAPVSPAVEQRAQPDAVARQASPKKSAEETEEPRFRFYDMLPKFEVVIPEEEAPVVTKTPQVAIETPGIYVLQAGSFAKYADADRRKAQLAMLGVESGIQKVTVDDKVYHRVRVGPLENLDELQRLRRQLSSAKIDAVVLRVGE